MSLASGRSQVLSLPRSGTVGDLKLAAQESFGQPFLRLVTVGNGCRPLDPDESLETVASHLASDDLLSISAVRQEVKIAATWRAFAVWCVGGDRIVTWGHPDQQDGSHGSHRFKDVREVHATQRAFAAILGDGSVATWGNPHWGGDSTAVQAQLKNVQQLQGTGGGAFAAILSNKTLLTWGNTCRGWRCWM